MRPEVRVEGERGIQVPLAHRHEGRREVQRRNRYVVTKGGKRFLFVTPLSPTARTLQVIVNWTARLKPAGAR